MEELENLEETLNESIRESIGARSGKQSRGKTKGAAEDDEEFSRYLFCDKYLCKQYSTPHQYNLNSKCKLSDVLFSSLVSFLLQVNHILMISC